MHSEKFETVKKYFDLDLWTVEKVRNAVAKNFITEEEFTIITGSNYTK